MGRLGLIDGLLPVAGQRRCFAAGRRQQQAGSPGQGPAPSAQAGRRRLVPGRPGGTVSERWLARVSPVVVPPSRSGDSQPPSPATPAAVRQGGHDALEAIAGSDRSPLAGPAWQSGLGVAASAAPRPKMTGQAALRGSRGVRQASIHCLTK